MKNFIYKIDEETIDDKSAKKILQKISKIKKPLLDMGMVKNIKSKLFIKYLLEDKFKLFNLENDLLIYLAIVLKGGFLKTYMSALDFASQKRELIRRRFRLV